MAQSSAQRSQIARKRSRNRGKFAAGGSNATVHRGMVVNGPLLGRGYRKTYGAHAVPKAKNYLTAQQRQRVNVRAVKVGLATMSPAGGVMYRANAMNKAAYRKAYLSSHRSSGRKRR